MATWSKMRLLIGEWLRNNSPSLAAHKTNEKHWLDVWVLKQTIKIHCDGLNDIFRPAGGIGT
jgi:hypothetical protein